MNELNLCTEYIQYTNELFVLQTQGEHYTQRIATSKDFVLTTMIVSWKVNKPMSSQKFL